MYPEVAGMGQRQKPGWGAQELGGVERTGSELNFKNCLGIPQSNVSIGIEEVLQGMPCGKTHIKSILRA